MRGMDKMFQSITGISSEEMKQYVSNAIEILRSVDQRLQTIEKNCVEANERIKRLEIEAGIKSPLAMIENTHELESAEHDNKE